MLFRSTCTEVLVRLRQPPMMHRLHTLAQNHIRLRVSPDVTIAMGIMVMAAGDDLATQAVEIVGSHHPSPEEMDAYEKVIGDAMSGNATLFARQDYVEEAWRIVDPVLKTSTEVYEYEPSTWGPDAAQSIAPASGWYNPVIAAQQVAAAEGHAA